MTRHVITLVPRMSDPTVVVVFRSGWRQPLDRATGFELWDVTGHRSTIPGELVLQLLMHYLRGLTLSEHLRQEVLVHPDPPSVPPVVAASQTRGPRTAPRLRLPPGRRLRGRPWSPQ